MKYVKDPVHGDVELPEEVLTLVDHPLFQRLRRVKQLDLTYLVYPSANHSRFEHSLGVYHVTKHATDDSTVHVYGLLHDVGHGPFSHLMELALRFHGYAFNHEERIEEIARDVLADSVFSFREVFRNPENALVYGGVGTDRIDYLIRDSYFTGVKIGYVDWQRLTRNMWVEGKRLVISPKVVPDAEHLYVARFILADAVYLHKTSLVLSEMFKRAVGDLLNQYSPRELISLDDEGLICLLRKVNSPWWRLIEERKPYKIVFTGDENSARELFEKYSSKCGDCAILGHRETFYSKPDVYVEGMGTLLEVSPLIRSLRRSEEKREYWFVAVDPKILLL